MHVSNLVSLIQVNFSFRVATIGGHTVYKIEDTMIYPINLPGSKPTHPDESKWVSNKCYNNLSNCEHNVEWLQHCIVHVSSLHEVPLDSCRMLVVLFFLQVLEGVSKRRLIKQLLLQLFVRPHSFPPVPDADQPRSLSCTVPQVHLERSHVDGVWGSSSSQVGPAHHLWLCGTVQYPWL